MENGKKGENIALVFALIIVVISSIAFTFLLVRESNIASAFAIFMRDTGKEPVHHPADLNKDWKIDRGEINKYEACMENSCRAYLGKIIPKSHYENAELIVKSNEMGDYHHINKKENCMNDACWEPDYE